MRKNMKGERISIKIRRYLSPADGYGMRFLPVIKAMPKEILPIVKKPEKLKGQS
jgi:UTP-glucose-1-phosphate uridylyltransferase